MKWKDGNFAIDTMGKYQSAGQLSESVQDRDKQGSEMKRSW